MLDRTSLLFPVEIDSRELDFRLVFAGLCAEAGNRVIIAQHDVLHEAIDDLGSGVYVGKNVFEDLPPTDFTRYRALKDRGFDLVHLDEEGLVAGGDDRAVWAAGLEQRLDPARLDGSDWVCAWGDWQRDFYRARRPSAADRVVHDRSSAV